MQRTPRLLSLRVAWRGAGALRVARRAALSTLPTRLEQPRAALSSAAALLESEEEESAECASFQLGGIRVDGLPFGPEAVRLDRAKGFLELDGLVEGGVTSRFPFVWLRDNCVCDSCFHAASSSRLTSFASLDLTDTIVRAEPEYAAVQDTRLGRGGGAAADEMTPCLRLSWSSGHESVFPLSWLRERCFSTARQRRRASEMDLFALIEASGLEEAEIGGAVAAAAAPVGPGRRESQCRVVPRFAMEELAASPRSMLAWCHAMQKYGVTVVKTDNASGVLKAFTELFGFREWCSYGEFYVVENKQTVVDGGESGEAQQANNLAYTGLPLQFHTDLPHYASPPQVQLLHCISQTSCPGGANKLVDGFAVAEQVRARHPAAFELLTSVKMEYKDFHTEVLWDSGPGGDAHSDGAAFGGRPNDTPRLGTRREVDFFLRQRHPIISLEDENQPHSSRVCRINYSDHHRDSIINHVSADQVQAYYHACKLFDTLLNDESNVLWTKSEPGDILCFDNRRILHGRSGFELSGGESRKLIGTYLRWDEIHSLARVKAATTFPDKLI